jgi:hypothetical protein
MLDQIMKRKKGLPIVCGYDPFISRIIPKTQPDVRNPVYRIQYVREPISALKSYNPVSGNCEKLTESLWMSLGLSNAAFLRKLQPFGISTVLDLRRILARNERADSGIQNYIASIAVKANPSPEMTVNELAQQMRNDFQMKVARGDHFGHMKAVYNVIYKPWTNKLATGLGLELSNMGRIKIGSPVKDCHIT